MKDYIISGPIIHTIRDLLYEIYSLEDCNPVNFKIVKSLAKTIDLLTNNMDGAEGLFTPSEYANEIITLLSLKDYGISDKLDTKIDYAVLTLAEMIKITWDEKEGDEINGDPN